VIEPVEIPHQVRNDAKVDCLKLKSNRITRL